MDAVLAFEGWKRVSADTRGEALCGGVSPRSVLRLPTRAKNLRLHCRDEIAKLRI